MSRNLPAGQCILINTNGIHSNKCTHPNRAIVLQIPIEFMETYIPEVSQLLFLWNPETQDPIMRTKLDRMKDTLTQMQIANDIRPEGFLLRFNSLLFELLFQLYHNFSVQVLKPDVNQKNKALSRLDPVLTYTARN